MYNWKTRRLAFAIFMSLMLSSLLLAGVAAAEDNPPVEIGDLQGYYSIESPLSTTISVEPQIVTVKLKDGTQVQASAEFNPNTFTLTKTEEWQEAIDLDGRQLYLQLPDGSGQTIRLVAIVGHEIGQDGRPVRLDFSGSPVDDQGRSLGLGEIKIVLRLSTVQPLPELTHAGESSSPAPVISVMVLPLQEAVMRHADGIREAIQVEGQIGGQADGSASGTIELTAAGEVVERLTALMWRDVFADENGDIVRADLLARTASDEDVIVIADLNSYDPHIAVGGDYTIFGTSDAASGITSNLDIWAWEKRLE